ncbi:hypothetical protein AUK18_01070 [Candidatus Beckwithbacteria bacterium CG2_30_44_31]|uniref:Glycosyltransferase RgtA/B/C/D-like domain-containing protein n=1 Tax=Candidatus Beckwithbacteria bacterium CG2_30_44_31 TaxID=1805035 RepID=A0A1J5AYE4_9BACT|nr:MAG: hypothetical protein AUK18_01070 [Candidatus Beckwithbacteria bacterium CG2_30_44_31]
MIAKFSWLIILILLALILTDHLAKPFIGHHDWNGVFYSQIARNYLRFGLLETKLGQLTGPNSFYTHYPPLFPLTLAAAFKVFGISDLVSRLVPVGLTIAGLLVLYRISSSWVVIAVALTPMLRYFGQMPSQEPLIIFLTLLSFYFFRKKNRVGFYLSVILNGLSGWAGYFFYPLLFFLNRRWALKACLLLVMTFSLHLLHVYILTGSFSGGGIFDALLLRLGFFPMLGKTEPELAGQFTWLAYLIKEARMLTVYYTFTLLSLAALGLLFCRNRITLIFLAWGLSYPLIFSNVVFVHEYFNVFFWPFLALSLVNLINRIKLKPALILIIFLAIFLERNKFYQALVKTKAFEPGYQLGLEINRLIPFGQTYTVVNSREFIESQNLFIDYYSDRQIEYIKINEP